MRALVYVELALAHSTSRPSARARIECPCPDRVLAGDTAALLARLPQLAAATAAAATKTPNLHAPSGATAATAGSSGGGKGGGGNAVGVGRAHVLAGTCVASGALVDVLQVEACARARQRAEQALLERRR